MSVNREYIYQNSAGESIIFSPSSDFFPTLIEGITSNEVDITTTQHIYQIGTDISNITVGGRSITIEGFIKDKFSYNRNKMLELISPNDRGQLICKLPNGEKYFLDVTPSQTPVIETPIFTKWSKFQFFQFSLFAPFPYWRNKRKVESFLNGYRPMLAFPRVINPNGTKPFKRSTLERGVFITIDNDSGQDLGLQFHLKAKTEVVNPKIIQVSTGYFLELNYTMQPSELIVINTDYMRKSIKSSINGNIMKNMDLIKSRFLMLEKGRNIFKFESQTNTQGVDVICYHDDIKVGI